MIYSSTPLPFAPPTGFRHGPHARITLLYWYPRFFRTTVGLVLLPGAGLVGVCFDPWAGFAAASCGGVAFCVAAAFFAGGGVGGGTGVSSGNHLR